MSSHFIPDIEIIDFKCFKEFKVEGFKRVNLITGKNNVGKTALLEAIYINLSSVRSIGYLFPSIMGVKYRRENLNLIGLPQNYQQYFFEHLQGCKIKTLFSDFIYSITELNGVKQYCFNINDKPLVILSNNFWPNNMAYNLDFYYIIDRPVFIDNFGFSDKELIGYFNFVQKKDKEAELNSLIKKFDSSIENFKVIGNKPQCKTTSNNTSFYRDIVEFGDGLKHYISIICTLYAAENCYLFIDEIDNGIHYTQLDNVWELIFKISKITNCQVFATTHSKEMLESYVRVAKKLEEREVAYINLVKNKNQEIKAISFDYDMLEYSILDQAHEIR